jgi:inner membrane protein
MPFRDRWYYGDTLFIVDPWLLLLLGAGIWLARRGERAGRTRWERPARLTLAIAALYTGAMAAGTLVARGAVSALASGQAGASGRAMVSAVPANPFRRRVFVDRGSGYRIGTYRFLARPAVLWHTEVDKGPVGDPAVAAALADPAARPFLHWARWPAVRIVGTETEPIVRLFDVRYADGGTRSWASIDINPGGRSVGSR